MACGGGLATLPSDRNVKLDGLNFAILGYSPGAMAEGNWSVGLITDERASAWQQQALTTIASGQAGGPMAAVVPLIGKFLGVQAQPICYQKDGITRSVSIPGILDQAVEGVAPWGVSLRLSRCISTTRLIRPIADWR